MKFYQVLIWRSKMKTNIAFVYVRLFQHRSSCKMWKLSIFFLNGTNDTNWIKVIKQLIVNKQI